MEPTSLAVTFLSMIENQKQELISLRPHEFNLLKGLLPGIEPTRTFKNKTGDIMILQILRVRTCRELRSKYKLKTSKQVKDEVQEVYREETGERCHLQ